MQFTVRSRCVIFDVASMRHSVFGTVRQLEQGWPRAADKGDGNRGQCGECQVVEPRYQTMLLRQHFRN